ncbi:MAG TPA: hypothetical protein VJT31_20335 [Rugosimonospora sp.]|nr:hypothetical protein [Rugosimonospora sp.]
MKRRLLRLGTAAVMAVGVALPATAQPAQADVGTVIAVVKQVYSLYQQFFKSSGLTLQQAVDQIKAAIQSAQTAIINQIDLVAVAQVRACAESAVINFADINAFTPDNLQVFALDATSCVTLAQSLIPAVTATPAAVDQAGFAMNTVGPIALMARAKAGLTTASLTSVLVSGENSLISSLVPPCVRDNLTGGEPGAGKIFAWDCTAYNGDEAEVIIRGDTNAAKAQSQDYAGRNTSRGVAQAVLPLLTS